VAYLAIWVRRVDVLPEKKLAFTLVPLFLNDILLMLHVEIWRENVPADQAVVPGKLRSRFRIGLVCTFRKNRVDVGGAFILLLCAHGLQIKASMNELGGEIQTYLMICIAECLDLLISFAWIDGIVLFCIGGVGVMTLVGFRSVRLRGPIFLVLRRGLAKVAAWVWVWSIARFTLGGHGVIWVNRLCRWTRNAIRSTCRRGEFCDKRVEQGLDGRGCSRWGYGLIVVGVIEKFDFRRIAKFAVRTYSAAFRCHGELRGWG